MFAKKLVLTALTASALLLTGMASASTVTLNPSANNGGLGVIDPGVGAFDTTGGVLQLGTSSAPSVLTIAGLSGVQHFNEAGTIYIDSFTNGASNTPVGAGSYSIYGTYNIDGFGGWTNNVYAANPSTINFTMTLYALTSTSATITLGTASLVNDPTNYAIAFLGAVPCVPTANLTCDKGSANTVLGATLGFTPAAGTTGAGGFFQAPSPFAININVGSIGGNSGNTRYAVDANGVVTVTTPIANQSPSTGNFTLTPVPEPSVLSLAGIALVGLGFASRRKARKNA
jgi:hypothetical protein